MLAQQLTHLAIFVVLVAVNACSGGIEPRSTESLGNRADGLEVRPTEILLDGVKLGTIQDEAVISAELVKRGPRKPAPETNAQALLRYRDHDVVRVYEPNVILDIAIAPVVPAKTVLSLIELATHAGWHVLRLNAAIDGKRQRLVCLVVREDGPWEMDEAAELVKLSILVDIPNIRIGLSRIEELQEVPVSDLATLERHIKEHGASSFLSDRDDVELAATANVTSEQLLPVIERLCPEFPAIQARAPTALSARVARPK